MKIAYLVNYSIEKKDGVTAKIATQIGEWRKAGHNVQLYSLFSEASVPVVEARQYPCRGALARKIGLVGAALRDMAKYGPDIVYFRYTYWNRTLGAIQRAYANVAEINADDLKEHWLNLTDAKGVRTFVKFLLDIALRGPVLRSADGLAAVTEQLANSGSFKGCRGKRGVFPNGYDLATVKSRKSASPGAGRTGLFFIGSPGQAWHGVDIIEKLAGAMPEYDFHIVGQDGQNGANLSFYGFLDETGYAGILSRCSICIGTLAAFRKGLDEACPLKVREYIAKGYPVIIGYEDSAFRMAGAMPEWALRIDASREIDTGIVKDFVERMKNYVVSREDAEKYVGAAGIEKRRVEFLESVSKGARGHA